VSNVAKHVLAILALVLGFLLVLLPAYYAWHLHQETLSIVKQLEEMKVDDVNG